MNEVLNIPDCNFTLVAREPDKDGWIEPHQQRTIVTFDMWGQRSETIFDDTSELSPLTWLRTLFDKGWLRPIEVRLENGVILYTQEQILKLFEE